MACLDASAPPAASSTTLAHRANPARSLAARAQVGADAHARVLNLLPHSLLLSDTRTRTDQSQHASAAGPDGAVNELVLKGLQPKCRGGVDGERASQLAYASPDTHTLGFEVQACNSHVWRCEEASRCKFDSCRGRGQD